MDIKKLTQKARNHKCGYVLHTDLIENEREIHCLIRSNEENYQAGEHTKCHCIVIYNEITSKTFTDMSLQEKIYIDSFYITTDPDVPTVFPVYFDRVPRGIRHFTSEMDCISYIDKIMKKNIEKIKQDKNITAEKEELKQILYPLTTLTAHLPEMRRKLDMLTLGTPEGTKLQETASETLLELTKVIKQLNLYTSKLENHHENIDESLNIVEME